MNIFKKRDRTETVIILACLLGLLLTGGLLYFSNSGSRGRDGESLGFVKPSGDDVRLRGQEETEWNNVPRDTNVYRNDRVFTGATSTARVRLKHKEDFTVEPNSLIRITDEDDKTILGLENGGFLGELKKGAKLFIRTKDKITEVTSDGGTIKLNSSGGNLKVEVLSGTASVAKAGKAPVEIKENQEAEVDDNKEDVAITNDDVALISPKPGVVLFQKEEKVTFEWKLLGPVNGALRLDVSADPAFETLIFSKQVAGTSQETNLPPGRVYFWRIVAADTAAKHSGISSFNFSRLAPPRVNKEAKLEVDLKDGKILSPMEFRWVDPSISDSYTYEISQDRSFSKILSTEDTSKDNVVFGDLGAGEYFWRVTSKYPGRENLTSETAHLTLLSKAPQNAEPTEVPRGMASLNPPATEAPATLPPPVKKEAALETLPPTTVAPTTLPATTTEAPTTAPLATVAPTTAAPTTLPATTTEAPTTSAAPTTLAALPPAPPVPTVPSTTLAPPPATSTSTLTTTLPPPTTTLPAPVMAKPAINEQALNFELYQDGLEKDMLAPGFVRVSQPAFSWQAVPDAQSYDVEFATSEGFDKLSAQQTTQEPSFVWAKPQVGQFFVRVASKKGEERGVSDPRKLRTMLAPPAFTRLDIDSVVNEGATLKAKVKAHALAAQTEVQISNDMQFVNPDKIKTRSKTMTLELSEPGMKYVRARSLNASGWPISRFSKVQQVEAPTWIPTAEEKAAVLAEKEKAEKDAKKAKDQAENEEKNDHVRNHYLPIPKYHVWGGLGMNYIMFGQTSPLLGDATYNQLSIPTYGVGAGLRLNEHSSLEFEYHDRPSSIGVKNLVIDKSTYEWKTMIFEYNSRFYEGEYGSLAAMGGVQTQQFPFIALTNAGVVNMRENEIDNLSVGLKYNYLSNANLDYEVFMRYQTILGAKSLESDSFTATPSLMFDGSLGVTRHYKSGLSLGTFWFGQEHSFKYTSTANGIPSSGSQNMFNSTIQFRLGYDFFGLGLVPMFRRRRRKPDDDQNTTDSDKTA